MRTPAADAGEWMHALATELFPICRSITGDGVRRTLDILSRHLSLTVHEVPTGTAVFDWTVPKEWNIHGAYIKDSRGRTILDFRNSNLHVVSYSTPVRRRISLAELRNHLHTLSEQPDLVPYRTSYYRETWGFCMADRLAAELEDGEYEVCIDATLEPGHLTYAECFLPGELQDEILISSHICHPSLANDNLSGVCINVALALYLSGVQRRHSFRFLFAPGTIGAITWLARNQEVAKRVKHGLVMTCAGDSGPFHYKRSRRLNADIDRAMAIALQHCDTPFQMLDFSPYGYDERQFCSPGFNLAVGCLMRSVHGEFPEYHTSADDLGFISAEALNETLELCQSLVGVLEGNEYYVNASPMCEPQLGRRGLYRATGGAGIGQENMATLWVLNQSDGTRSLLDIAERAGLPFRMIRQAADALVESGLLLRCQPPEMVGSSPS